MAHCQPLHRIAEVGLSEDARLALSKVLTAITKREEVENLDPVLTAFRTAGRLMEDWKTQCMINDALEIFPFDVLKQYFFKLHRQHLGYVDLSKDHPTESHLPNTDRQPEASREMINCIAAVDLKQSPNEIVDGIKILHFSGDWKPDLARVLDQEVWKPIMAVYYNTRNHFKYAVWVPSERRYHYIDDLDVSNVTRGKNITLTSGNGFWLHLVLLMKNPESQEWSTWAPAGWKVSRVHLK